MAGHGREAKRARPSSGDREALASVLHLGSVSNKGLAELLKRVREVGEVQATRRQLDYMNVGAFLQVRHAEELPLIAGGSWTWEFADPNRLLSLLVHESPALQDLFEQALARYPCSQERPWQLVVGFDEFIPGSKLKTHSERKAMNLSFSFIELGRDAIWHEACWVTPVCVRHSAIANVQGGFSAMLRRYLRLHLIGAAEIATAGVPLTLNGRHRSLFARLSFPLADG